MIDEDESSLTGFPWDCAWIALILSAALTHREFVVGFADELHLLSHNMVETQGRGQRLIELGLKAVEITTEEIYYADEIQSKNKRLSVYDCLAFAIVKFRGIVLLTGDRRLRLAAEREGVTVHGSLWIFDELLRCERITANEYKHYMLELKKHNGDRIRLPESEIDKRIL